jgi:hypothetical protein
MIRAMRRKNSIVVWVFGVAALAGAWKLGSWVLTEQPAAPERLVNQVWIERVPRDERDMFFHLIMVEHEDQRIGVAGRASNWRSHFDLFRWNVRGDVVNALFPQDNKRFSMKARTWACEGEAPRPFELCLELKGERQNIKLFSRREWVVRPGEAPPEGLNAVASGLAAATAAPAGELPEEIADDGVSLIE